jgi:hypothetical protein
MEEQPNINPED